MFQLNTVVDLRAENEQVLNTAACLGRLAEFTAFENSHFGASFAWSIELNKHWADSCAAVHAAIIRDRVNPQYVAAMTVLLVHPDSCRRLVAGEIKETELQPWTRDSVGSGPVIYFATVIASTKAELPVLYGSLGQDTVALLQQERLQSREGLAIAFGDSGRRHLERNGFRPLGNACYLGQHLFMRITPDDAQTSFWREAFAACEAPPSVSRDLDPFDAAPSGQFQR